MKKLIFDINNDDDFQIEGVDISKSIIFTGKSNNEVLDKLQKFIENKIRKIIVLGSSSYNSQTIKCWRGERITNVENALSQIYKAAGDLKEQYNNPAGNWSLSYKIINYD